MRPLLAMALLACGGEPTAEQRFERDVVPVLEQSCAATSCHGVAPNYQALGETVDWNTLQFVVENGRLTHLADARTAALRAINTVEDPKFSSLLRKPLAEVYGGLPHFGAANFVSPEDASYQAVEAWIASESSGGQDPEPLTALEQQFANQVMPLLSSLTCTSSNCHGTSSAIPFNLDAGVGADVSIEGIRRNRKAALHQVSLDGNPMQSRLLRKALPLWDGGLVHRGGNSNFLLGQDDERLAPIRQWICAERQSALGSGCDANNNPVPEALVFIRGPVAPEDAFDVDVFNPGSDLFLVPVLNGALDVGPATNLTETLHNGPADVRDPAVDPEGERVAFTLRTDAATGHNLWELDLATGQATQLTNDAGPLPRGGLRTYRDPAYGPDGRLYFVSSAAGVLADDGQRMDADIYEMDLASGVITRRSWTPHIERELTYYVSKEEIAFTALRDAIASQAKAHPFRFPPGLKTEYHQHFGVTSEENMVRDMRELADARFVTVLGDLSNLWGGRLGIVDRNMGPEIPSYAPSQVPSLPGFTPPMARLDPLAQSSGISEGVYRDPVGLPNGQLLAAYSPGVLDHADASASPQFGVVQITLTEAPDGSGTQIARRRLLIENATDPEPVFRRYLPDSTPDWSWDPQGSTGTLNHQGFDLIDGMIGNLFPSGTKAPTADFSAVRIIEALPMTPDQRRPVPPEETRFGETGASTVSLGVHGPSRILGELDLAEDGTFHAQLPAHVAFRLQGLDGQGRAVGVMHNRWFDMHPGQTIPQGVQPNHYATLCAPCHGAESGVAEQTLVEPDLLTTASLTLSRYENQNPRRPVPAPNLGEDSRITVDFGRDLHPILEARCASCHNTEAPTLTSAATTHYSDAYESLMAPGTGSLNGRAYVNESDGSAYGSYLIELLSGEELGAPRTLTSPGERHGDLTDDELNTFVRWVDLGATWTGLESP